MGKKSDRRREEKIMSMSDCSRCWNTPCICGWEYIHWEEDYIIDQIHMLTKVLFFQRKYGVINVHDFIANSDDLVKKFNKFFYEEKE